MLRFILGHRSFFCLFPSCLLVLLATKVDAVLTLTPAAQTAGFGLSTFATGFPTTGGIGPLGIAFPSSGGVLVTDYPGNIRLFPTDTDGQVAGTGAGMVAPLANHGSTNAVGLSFVGSNLYMCQQGAGKLLQLNANGTLNQLIVSISNATGIVANPSNGHLFVSCPALDQIYEVDPIAKSATLFTSPPHPDGLAMTPDGMRLYVAVVGQNKVVGYNTLSKAVEFDSGAISGGIDGIALGEGTLAGNLFVNTNGGTVVEINILSKAQTVLASGGSRGDFVAVDPANGTLLLTQSNAVVRLSPPVCGSFGGRQCNGAVAQDSCVHYVDVNAKHSVRVYFSVVNFNSVLPICGLRFVPEGAPVDPGCKIVACSHPQNWSCLLENDGAKWSTITSCIASGTIQRGFDFLLDPEFCCYLVDFLGPEGQVLFQNEECFSCVSTPIQKQSWSRMKQLYR